MAETDSVQTLSIKGLPLPDDQRSSYSIEAPITPPPSYMKVTSSGKLKIVKILAATLLLLTLLIGSFVLGGVYISSQGQTCDCPCAAKPVDTSTSPTGSVIPGARLAFLKGEAPKTQEAVPSEPEVVELKKKKKKERNNEEKKNKKNKKKQQQKKRDQEEPETNEIQVPNFFRSLNLPRLLRTLEKATDDMAERIMEQTRRNRIACLMERRRESSPFSRRNPFLEGDSGPHRRHLILAPGGNGLIDCDEVLGGRGENEMVPPPHPFSRAIRARTVTLPIMAIVSRGNHHHEEDSEQPSFPPPPSPFNQPPPPPPEVFPRGLFQHRAHEEKESGPMEEPDFEEETVPNFQASSSPIMYRHPLHSDAPNNRMFDPVLSRFPRK